MKVKGITLTFAEEAFLDVMESLAENTMTEQDAIARLVKGGHSSTSEAAKETIKGIRQTIYAASLPPDSELII